VEQILVNFLNFMNLLKLQPITFISLFTAYYFYKRSTRKKEVLYTKVNVKISQNYNKEISDSVSKHKDKSVDSITVTRYLLWNNSSQAIRQNDIAPRDPLQFSVTRRMTGDGPLSLSATDLKEKRREMIKEWIDSGRIEAG